MRILLSLLLAAHALAHVASFLAYWKWLPGPDSDRTTVLAGRVDVGVRGMRILGVLWIAAGVLVAVAAVHMFRNTPDAYAITWSAAVFSGIMSILGWPDSQTGAVLNGLVMALLVWMGVSF
jgi:hypothetical protein